ncbi:MAG: hypothetical protein J6T97_08790 [Bacteroidaceae bacterium]|nr:hypothetical protein [Bacteroidaceae bacterium]
MKRFLIPIILMTMFATADAQNAKAVSADKPEKIVTFVKTEYSADWYAKQAKLWEAEVKKNPNNDDAWLNWYRATRYEIMHAAWDALNEGKTNTVEEDYSPLKKFAERLAKERPNSYARYMIDYYCQNFVNGFECEDNMMKAIKMRPDPDNEEIYADYVVYLLRKGETDLMAEILKKWYNTGQYSYNILSYSYNVLAGMEPGGILFVNGDAAVFSALLVKYGKDLFKDKTIICAGLLTAPGYLEHICKELGMELDVDLKTAPQNNYIDDQYRRWSCKIFTAFAEKSGRPVYFSTFLSEANDRKFQQNLYSEGLVYKYSNVKYDNLAVKRKNFEEVYLTDYLYETFVPETYNATAYKINLNYLPCFSSLLNYYRSTGNKVQEDKLYKMLKHILDSSKDLLDDQDYKRYYDEIDR